MTGSQLALVVVLTTYLDLFLGEGDTLHEGKTRLLVGLLVVPVRLLEYHLVVESVSQTR